MFFEPSTTAVILFPCPHAGALHHIPRASTVSPGNSQPPEAVPLTESLPSIPAATTPAIIIFGAVKRKMTTAPVLRGRLTGQGLSVTSPSWEDVWFSYVGWGPKVSRLAHFVEFGPASGSPT